MTLRHLRIAAALVALFSTADGAAKTAAPPAKVDKKKLAIERHQWMAEYYVMRANDLPSAIKEYQAVLALDAQNEPSVLALASIYARSKKEKAAVDLLDKLTQKNPQDKNAWMALAEIQSAAGNDAATHAALAKVAALDPANANALGLLYTRAEKRFRGGDASAKPEVLETARKLMQTSREKNGPAYLALERTVVELSGDPVDLTVYDAKRAFSSAFEAGRMGAINAQMAQARQGFESCVQMKPTNEECHYYLGLVHSSVSASEAYDLKQALGELARAPNLGLAWVETARILRTQDHNDDARAALDKALALDGGLAVAHLELGILDKLDGKTEAAVTQFGAAIDADPVGPVGDRALTELSKADPSNPRVAEGMMSGHGGDVFSTDRYRAVVDMMERSLGGVWPQEPEQAVLEAVVRKLSEGSALTQHFKVQLLGTSMVNAFATADGRVYATRGLFEMIARSAPGKPIDANNDVLGHILAHELTHVIRQHTMRTAVFQQAVRDASQPLDPAILTHVTRLHEMDADREGMVMAFLAGYHPRGGIEFMELMGKQMEVPKHLDHPTFQERVEYLSDYWTNDVQYAFVSFKLGVEAMDRGAEQETTDMAQAVASYQAAIEDFRRFQTMLPSLKEAMNDLGIANAKLGVLAMDRGDSPLGRWQTRFSLERESAVKYVGLVRDQGVAHTRGIEKARLPSQLRDAIAWFKQALAIDEDYGKARLNLATAYLATNQLENANATLAKVVPRADLTAADVDLIRGVALAEAKSYDGASAAFGRALSSPAAKRAAAYNLAKTLELAGKKPEAKAAYQQYVKTYPGGPWAKAAETAGARL